MTIREIRKELGLSQFEFARLLSVHQTAVSQWETGRTSPEIEIVKRISRISGHTVSDVLNVSDAEADAECFEARMTDGGMRGARIEEGDTVYVRPIRGEPENGAIFAVETEKGVLIRYLYRTADGLFLTPAAPGYAPLALKEGQKILGRVYAFRSVL